MLTCFKPIIKHPKCKLGVNPTKLCFLRFPIFDVMLSHFVTLKNNTLTMKWLSLIAKKRKEIFVLWRKNFNRMDSTSSKFLFQIRVSFKKFHIGCKFAFGWATSTLKQRFSTDGSRPYNGSWKTSNGSQIYFQ
jgi:hypothetical protein